MLSGLRNRDVTGVGRAGVTAWSLRCHRLADGVTAASSLRGRQRRSPQNPEGLGRDVPESVLTRLGLIGTLQELPRRQLPVATLNDARPAGGCLPGMLHRYPRGEPRAS
jgi:hypothetical protein